MKVKICFSLVVLGLFSFISAASMVDQNLDYTDHLIEIKKNPGRGVTSHKGFYLSPGKELNLKSNGTVYADFMRFLIDLGGFSSNAWTYEGEGESRIKVPRGVSGPLDEVSLNNIRAALDSLRRRGGSCTIRASYDDDCRGSQDPDIETTLIHTKQLAELYSDYEDVIHFVELGMFGTCGEMTTGGQDNHAKALQTFLENSSSGIKVGVRSPQVVALWMGLKDPYSTWYVYPDFHADSARFQDTAKSPNYAPYMNRVGLYNDGYLGSDNDLGTFGSGDPYPISREKVISWMEKYGVEVPYGGDFVCNYNPEGVRPINTGAFLAYEGFRTHTSYIGGSMSGECYNFMDTVTFIGPDMEYSGKTKEKEYARDHFGYRFVVRDSKIMDSVGIGGKLKMDVKLQNVGFGNNLMVKKATVILKQETATDTTIIELPMGIDPTKIYSKKLKMKTKDPLKAWLGYNFSDLMEDEPEFDGVNELAPKIRLPEDMPQGEWKVYMRISQYGDYKTDKNFHVIQFANDTNYFDKATGSNYLGKFVLSDKIEVVEDDDGLVEQSALNPNLIHVDFRSNMLNVHNATEVEVYNLQGKCVFKKFTSVMNEQIPLQLPQGMYVVYAHNKGMSKSLRIAIH